MSKHRTARQDRRLRRALERESLTSVAVKRLQGQRITQWAREDAERIAVQAERIASVRTLKYDEQSKAHTAPSAAAVVVGSAIWNENTTIDETRKDYLIPRKSLTERLFLRLFDPVKEFRDVPLRQLPADTRAKLAKIAKLIRRAHPDNRRALAEKLMKGIDLTLGPTVTNPRLEWKSPTTLLRTNKPDQLSTVALIRVTHRTKERNFEKESVDLPTWDETTPRTWDDERQSSDGLAGAQFASPLSQRLQP